MLAQTDPVQLLQTWWVVVAAALPFVYAFFVRAGAAKLFRFAVSLLLSVVIAFVSVGPLDWSGATPELVMNRVFVFIGIVQTVYKTADLMVGAWLLEQEDVGLADHPLFRPDWGVDQHTLTRRR